MALLTEEQIKKLQASATRFPDVNETCIGCTVCTTVSSDVFEMNDEGVSTVQFCPSYEDKDVDDAIAACPVDAISWQS